MVGSRGRVCWALLYCCLLSTLCCGREVEISSATVVKHLLQAQQQAKDGVIHFNSQTFAEFIRGKHRPFSLYMFLTANHVADKPGLSSMRQEFGYLANAYKQKISKGEVEHSGTLFFAEAEFKESQEVFQRLGVTALPFVFIMSGSFPADSERIKLRQDDILKPETYDTFPWTADEFNTFLSDRTGVRVEGVVRPSLFSSPLFPFVALTFLALGTVTAYRLYYAPFMKNLWIWCVGAIAVYWFSVSGGMHNIIRGIPLYVLTQQGAQFFMPPGQGQLGAEGFLCGTGYLLIGLSVSGITYMHKLRQFDQQKMRYIAFAIIAVGVWTFFKVVGVYRWKTGYHWRTYFGGWRR